MQKLNSLEQYFWGIRCPTCTIQNISGVNSSNHNKAAGTRITTLKAELTKHQALRKTTPNHGEGGQKLMFKDKKYSSRAFRMPKTKSTVSIDWTTNASEFCRMQQVSRLIDVGTLDVLVR
eukprot:4381966-Amphidinium_carterae.1